MVKLKKDTNQILIETTIRKYLREISLSPERSIRNLVDLALNFSNGRFQRNFLKTAQTMLKDKKSAYYELLRNAITDIDHDTISTFGINLGYNSCTKGARHIRSIEAKEHFNIPWSLTFVIDQNAWMANNSCYRLAVQQGKDLGIYTYFLFLKDELPGLAEFLMQNKDCAFILFAEAKQITSKWLGELSALHNLMISVNEQSDFPSACELLRNKKFLFALHKKYTAQDKDAILNGHWIETALSCRAYFLFLYPDESVPEEMQEEIYQYITDHRNKQLHPSFLMDLTHDNLLIDRIISDNACWAAFGPDGQLSVSSGYTASPDMNFFQKPLYEIFRSVLVKN